MSREAFPTFVASFMKFAKVSKGFPKFFSPLKECF